MKLYSFVTTATESRQIWAGETQAVGDAWVSLGSPSSSHGTWKFLVSSILSFLLVLLSCSLHTAHTCLCCKIFIILRMESFQFMNGLWLWQLSIIRETKSQQATARERGTKSYPSSWNCCRIDNCWEESVFLKGVVPGRSVAVLLVDTGPRVDGEHKLDSIFFFFKLGDDVEFVGKELGRPERSG